MKTARFVFWLGIVVMIVGVVGNGSMLLQVFNENVLRSNTNVYVISVLGPIWQGGVLIALSKIIERLDYKGQ